MRLVVFLLGLFLVFYVSWQVKCLDNGLALTPPMGWLAWERFRCVTDCDKFPETCISQKLFMDMADKLVGDGWLEAGYHIVHIDDCWPLKERDANSKLVPDPDRFPDGIDSLAAYIHSKGLKLGIYGDYGTKTCGGYPGSMGYEKIDAETFAKWGVDMLKLDGCYSSAAEQEVGYPLMGKELNATGREMIYECSWPAYEGGLPPAVNYTLLGEICNLWRNYGDIQDSFADVINIINWWGKNQDVLIPAAGPGRWNDPDMLIGGDFSLSVDEAKLQFGMWAILAAPLFMSNDLRNITNEFKEVLQNKKIIDVNQDPLGIQGQRVKIENDIQLWKRPLIKQEYAIAIFSTRTDGTPYQYSFKIYDLKIEKPASKYKLTDLYAKNSTNVKVFGIDDTITVPVNPSGIQMLRIAPVVVPNSFYNDIREFDIL